MRHKRLIALLIGVGGLVAIILTVAIAHISAQPPGKLDADATLVNLAGMCPQGFTRTLNLRNDGGQAIQWQASALEESDVTDVRMSPSTGTLQPHTQQVVQVQGHTLSGGFKVIFHWQGNPVNVQFSCNGPQ